MRARGRGYAKPRPNRQSFDRSLGVATSERAVSESTRRAWAEAHARAEESQRQAGLPHVVIRPTSGWASLGLRELWQYRELLYFLVWRDVKVRYKQTAVGALWAILQPTLLMILFSIVFGHLAKIDTGGVPYPVFAYAGLLPWLLFVNSMTQSSTSLVLNSDLITKVYFPRLAIPLATVIAAVVDFLIASSVLVGLMAYYEIAPSLAVLTLPLFVLLAVLTALGVGVWLSALNVKYRDVQYTINFLVMLWLFATPIAYSIHIVPDSLQWIYGLNPMSGVVEGFRWALFQKTAAPSSLIFISAAMMAVVLLSGITYFRKTERSFADVI
jgi:lipopolysaccharide transport system permease protein